MANRIVGNTYIIDSAGAALSWPRNTKVHSVAFYATDTTGELRLVATADTTNTMIHIRSNQNQPFTFPLYLGGVYMEQLTPITVTAGTAWVYFV